MLLSRDEDLVTLLAQIGRQNDCRNGKLRAQLQSSVDKTLDSTFNR